MNPMLHPDMLKATQLTRKGRLVEATRLIQRLLHGGASDSAGETAAPRAGSACSPITIDGTADRIEEAVTGGSRTARTKTPLDTGETTNAEEKFAWPASADALHGLRIDLGQLGHAARQQQARHMPVVPEGAQFLTRRFTGAAGGRDYKLYIPSCYRAEPLPLIVMLHGCTQSADDFAIGTRMNDVAEEHGLFVAYPMQAKSANISGCWNWFKPGDQRRDGGEPSLIAGITSYIAGGFKVDPDRIYVAGLSAGGAAAAIMGAAYPDIFAAVGVHSGLPVGAASDLPSALAAMRQGSSGAGKKGAGDGPNFAHTVPSIVFHGDRDMTVHPSNGAHIIEQIRSAQASELRELSYRGKASAGRTFSRTCHIDTEDRAIIEMWVLHGAGHAWSGGSAAGSYTDPHGPDASREMVRFFLQHTRAVPIS
jgi:poly(hydroxyalkanoate) depolymerase family esterase